MNKGGSCNSKITSWWLPSRSQRCQLEAIPYSAVCQGEGCMSFRQRQWDYLKPPRPAAWAYAADFAWSPFSKCFLAAFHWQSSGDRNICKMGISNIWGW